MSRILIYYILLILAFFVFSCKKKEAEPVPTIADKIITKPWVGKTAKATVKLSAIPGQSDLPPQDIDISAFVITFKADKTFSFTSTAGGTPQVGSWEMQSNDTKIKLTGGFQAQLPT